LGVFLQERTVADDAVSIRHSLITRTTLPALRERVPTVVAWTVNDVRRALQLRDVGVSGVTTDRLTVLQALSEGPESAVEGWQTGERSAE
jgi:glycerophosphoryl diester phosphodiesterase